MKKTIRYISYELKKNIWTLVILTAVCTLFYVSTVSSMTMQGEYYMEGYGLPEYYICDSQVSTVLFMLGALCYIVPTLVYSFKMNKRSVDAYYSLPLKREKLFLAKSALGLVLTLVPFTVAYWLGFFALLVREGNPYQMTYYVPTYFGALFYGIMLFGVNAFVFTRANKTSDGVLFTIAYAFIGSLIVSWIDYAEIIKMYAQTASYFTPFGGFDRFGSYMSNLITGDTPEPWSHLAWIISLLYGVVGWFLLFWCVRYEKGENAEQISDSWYGYKVMIPLYTAFLLGLGEADPLSICSSLIAAIVATVVYQRKFRFAWKWWAVIGGAIVLGCILTIFT